MKTCILIIDDEVDFTFFVKKNLEATGKFDVLVANDGAQGIQRARQLRPNAILLDVMMSGMPGAEVATELQKYDETKKIPVIFLTALVREAETAKQSHEIGGHLFVAKPVKIDELVKTIAKMTAV